MTTIIEMDYNQSFFFSENIWKTDLDFMVPYKNRLQILHVITGGTINASLTTTQAPYHHPAAKIREYLDGEYLISFRK